MTDKTPDASHVVTNDGQLLLLDRLALFIVCSPGKTSTDKLLIEAATVTAQHLLACRQRQKKTYACFEGYVRSAFLLHALRRSVGVRTLTRALFVF